MTKIGLFSSKVFFSILLCTTIFAFLGCSDFLISSPTNLKVEKIYSDRIDLSWDPQLGATSYNLYFSTKNSFSSASALNVLLESAVGITGFEPNTKYYIWVTACNYSGESEPSQMVTATTFIGAPASVEMSFSDTDMILSWDKVSGAIGYEVYFGKKSQIDETTTKISVLDSNSSGSKVTETFDGVAVTDGIYYAWVFSKGEENTSTNYASTKKRKGDVFYQFHIEQAEKSNENYSLSVDPSDTEVFLIKTNVSNSAVAKEKTGGVLEVHENTLQNSSRNLAHFNIIGEKISSEKEYGDQLIESTPIRVDHKLSSDFNNTILTDYLSKKYSGRLESNAPQQRTVVPYTSVIGDTKGFWVDDSSGNFSKKTATLRAVGEYSYIWVVDDVFDNNSEQNNDNKLTQEQIKATAKKFDDIYGPATTIFGQTYKTFYENDISGAKDAFISPEEKISILICDIWDDYSAIQNSGIVGYFWAKDFGEDSDKNALRSNECEIFYIDSYFLDSYTEMTYSTLAHEFQHMLNFVNKYIELNKYAKTEEDLKIPSTWYNEMLSMVCEDLLQDIIGIEDKDSPRARLPLFNYSYLLNGLNEWWGEETGNTLYSYSHAYALGAFIVRNYGGAKLVKEMISNSDVDLESIVNAIKTCSGKSYSTSELLKEFARALCYPDGFEGSEDDKNTALGQAKEAGLKHFYRGNTCSIGGHEYNLKPIKLADYPFTTSDNKMTSYGPYLFGVDQVYDLRPYGITLHTFGLKTDSFTFNYIKPESNNVAAYFVVQ